MDEKEAEARPLMGTIFLVSLIGRAKRSPHWDVQSRFRVICICYSTGRSDIRDIFHEL